MQAELYSFKSFRVYTYFFLSRQCIDEFIELRESETRLWYVKSNDCDDRNKKDAAFAKLVDKQR